MDKYYKYIKACEFVSTIKKQTLSNGVTIYPDINQVVISHNKFQWLGGYCVTELGMKRLINKVAREANKLAKGEVKTFDASPLGKFVQSL
tara:strand:- start:286 stop:555 length:270 start_codon:yes stop_codon:yes gene_type:complete